MQHKNILILGAGNFGTCLAQHLARNGCTVQIWSRDPEIVASINNKHINQTCLPQIVLEAEIKAVSQLESIAFSKLDLVVLAVPTQALRDVFTQYSKLFAKNILVSVAKGIEVGTELFPTQILEEVCGKEIAQRLVILSGPSFAIEVANRQPTAVSAAGCNLEALLLVQNIFHSPYFRVYTNQDPLGLEIAGAMKNVIAIAAGACAGLGFLSNSRAALITRGLAEIRRIGLALGAQSSTFMGLGGVGDLFLTCSSEKSRNYRVGYLIAQGAKLPDVLQELGSVAEGVSTSKAAHNLAIRLKIDMPITRAVYSVLHTGKKVDEALAELLTRDANNELN